MANAKPFLTSNGIVDAIKLTMSFPITQNTFSYNNLLQFANQELSLSAVPSLMETHNEYFVYKVQLPLVNGIGRYPIPDRAIGMAISDVKYSDSNGNFYDTTRINPADKAFFQSSNGSNQTVGKYYLEGNEIVLTPQISTGATGFMNIFIYLRPNILVRDNRACIIQNFIKKLDILDNTLIQVGDIFTITTGNETPSPIISTFTAVSGSPANTYEFQIGVSSAATITNITNAVNGANISGIIATATTDLVSNIVLQSCEIDYDDISTTFTMTNNVGAATLGFAIDDNSFIDIQFDQLPTSYTDPDTNITSALYSTGCLVDFLQTNPGHRTYTYDIELVEIKAGNVGRFTARDLQGYLNNSGGFGPLEFFPIQIGDYIGLQNECIIPQIPPELHHALAERAASRIMMAMGDEKGYAMSQAKIQEMNRMQDTLIGSRVTNSVPKVFNRNSLLRAGKSRFYRY